MYQYTDNNNCTDTSAIVATVAECLSVNKLQMNDEILKVYPNPNKGEFIISSETSLIQSIIIRDLNGKIILMKQNLNVEAYKLNKIIEISGMYDLEIVTSEGHIHKRVQILK